MLLTLAKVIKQPHYGQPAAPRPAVPAARGSLPDPRATKKPIIEREIVGAGQEARQIVAEAEAHATRLVEEAQAQAAEIHQKAFDEGFQEGLGQHTEAIAQASVALQELRNTIEPAFIALVRSCVEKILGQEIKQHPDQVVSIVRNALRDAGQQREITVRIHPDDAPTLNKHQRRLLDVLARANTIEVREDPALTRGGCIVVTELGTIDASLERQLTAIETLLGDEFRSGGEGGGGEDYGQEPEEDEG